MGQGYSKRTYFDVNIGNFYDLKKPFFSDHRLDNFCLSSLDLPSINILVNVSQLKDVGAFQKYSYN